MKKIIALLLSAAVMGSAFAGCSSKTNTVDESQTSNTVENTEKSGSKDEGTTKELTKAEKLGLTPFEQKKPLKALLGIVGGIDDEEKKLWFDELNRLTGIEVDVEESTTEAELATIFASGESYDIVYMNGADYQKFQSMGMLKPLTDKIKNSKVLSDDKIIDPKLWDRATEEDGEVYVVYNKYDGATLPIMREDWMQKLGLQAPTTLDEYYEVFKAMTFNDPDGNGVDDTYGYTLRKINDLTPWMSAKGLMRGYAFDQDGKRYIPWATDEAAEVYDWLGNLYGEGLMDPNFITNGSGNCRDMIFSGKAGAFVYWDFWTGTFNTKVRAEDPNTSFEMKAYGPALDKDGNGMLAEGSPAYFTIPETAKEVDAAFALLEFLHTPEGNIMTTLGIKDHDYTLASDKYALTDVGEKHAMNHGSTVPLSKQWVNPVMTPLNSKEAMDIVYKYGRPQVELETSKLANEVVEKYAVKAMMQEITGEQAVKEMQKELKEKGLID